MEKDQGSQFGIQVSRFVPSGQVEVEAEVVESAYDETRGIQVHALLNNSIILMDGAFKTSQRFQHEGSKRINCVKLNDGLICVAGEDQATTFYDPRQQTAVKSIQRRGL